MTITVQGERYDDARDLYASILDAERQLEQMPSETTQHAEFAAHIERLREALPEGFDAESFAFGAVSPEVASDVKAVAAPDAETSSDDQEVEPEEDTPPVCPLCGSIGLLNEEPPQNPLSEQCPACRGIGIVFTGSRVEGHQVMNCPTCTGNGWVAKESDIPLPAPPTLANAAPAWEGAAWNPVANRWDPPPGVSPPWEGATWDGITGGYR